MIESLVALVTGPALLFLLGGVLLGLVFGAIPGLSATLAVVILIPVTYTLGTTEGMALLIGSYVGGMSGGYVASILLNMPGTPATVASCFDGHPLAQKGQAGKALGVGTFANLFGSLFGWLCLLLFGGALGAVAMNFGAFEMTAAILFGFAAVISLGGKSPLKALIAALLGLALSCIGYDAVSGMERATFGLPFLKNGFGYMPALIGLFVVAEVFKQVEEIGVKYVMPRQKIQNVLITLDEFKGEFVNFIRSSAIGVAIGLLPGIGGSFANFITYDQAKKHAKHPEEYGTGNIGGIVASEAGAMGTVGGALVPFIALGIPGDTVTAALLGGLMIKGIAPGPLFVAEHPDTVLAIYNAVFASSILVFIFMMLVGIRLFPRILRLPKYVLLPVVAVFALVGTYNMNFSMGDVWATLAFGLLGYAMGKIDMPKTPLVITMILGAAFETRLRTAMTLSGGSIVPFFTEPFALVFILATVVSVAAPIVQKRRAARKAAQAPAAPEAPAGGSA